MDFTDAEHVVAMLSLQGAEEIHSPQTLCDDDVIKALTRWRSRSAPHESGLECFRLDNCPAFEIGYDGQTDRYWPGVEENFLSEALVREFLFRDGVCRVDRNTPSVYKARYNLMAAEGTEYLLICPFTTSAGNIAGVCVVCVNRHLRPSQSRSGEPVAER